MGCASSKVLGDELVAEKGKPGFSKGISMPAHPQDLPDDFHIVALTSSTYGILKVDPPKAPEEDSKDSNKGAHSVNEVLNKLNNLESKAEAGPQSWLEVSSMLENLKPELDKPAANTKTGKAGNKPHQPDAIDIIDIMLDLDEDTGLVRPKARKLANLKKSGKSLPIRTLEELDKRLGGDGGNLKNSASSVVSIADVKASLKPVGTSKLSDKGASAKSANVSLPQNDVHKTSSDVGACYGEVKRNSDLGKRGSELIDDDFLQSYKSAFNTLSEDEWKAVEAMCEDGEYADSLFTSEDENHNVDSCMGMEQRDEHPSNSSFESQAISFIMEDDEENNLSLLMEGNPMKELPIAAEATMLKASDTKKSPLEEYEELCPPGGKGEVVLYTTSLRGTRKTYEECAKARDLVKSYGVLIDERDVSMHLEYRNELRELMQRVVTVPRLFIKGRYIGGGEVIAKLAEDGQLGQLLRGSTRANGDAQGAPCDGCAGAKFVPCLECSGSCKVFNGGKQAMRCPECNENGLIQCPICS